MYPEKFLSIAITNVLEGKPIVIHGRGQQVRDWIHARDHADGVLRILENGVLGETYMMGGGSERTIEETAKAVLRVMRVDPGMMVYVNDRPGQDRRYAMDFGKIHGELGWSPQRSFDEGLRDMVEWYRENEDWWRPIKESAGYQAWYRIQVKRNGQGL
jgi:dTDP-glucose 4,6-dehydratase